MQRMVCLALLATSLAALSSVLAAGKSSMETSRRICISGVYPHLAVFNDRFTETGVGETGIGAVVPWAGKLWAVTYSSHRPQGSADRLYEIAPDLTMTARPESVGGTPANRMIHRESNQLIIGPYLIDAKGVVRVIPPSKMYGRRDVRGQSAVFGNHHARTALPVSDQGRPEAFA